VIGLYCPDVPPVRGGVSDHTLALARALEAGGAPPVVLANRGDPQLFAPLTCITGLRPGDIAAAAAANGVTHLVLQYVPFLFARRGVSPALVRGIHRIHAAGLPLCVIVHEAFVPFTRIPWLVTGVPQRLQYRYLLQRATQVYAPLPRYTEIARHYAGTNSRVAMAPIGATIPVSRLSRKAARARLGLTDDRIAIGIFSPAASGFAHEWIAAAAARLAGHTRITWVCFGFGSERALPGYPAGANVMTVGETTAEAVSDTMRALDIAAAPYTDGLTMRRSGAMLALAHGVPVVSSEGHLFDAGLRALAACEPDAASFAERLGQLADEPALRETWAGRTAGYAELASIESLARRMIRDLEGRS